MMRIPMVWLAMMTLAIGSDCMAQPSVTNTPPDVFMVPGLYGNRYQSGVEWMANHFRDHVQHGPIAFLGEHRSWERLYVWTPKTGTGPHPCIVVYYGGGWGGKEVPMNWVKPLIERGYAIAIPDYALNSSMPEWQCIWDGAAAVRYLRAHAAALGIDGERIGVMGNSAGGWLVQGAFFEGPNRVRLYRNSRFLAMEPRPRVHPELSVRVQAAVTDWGASWLQHRNEKRHKILTIVTADDPPLLAPFGGSKPAPDAVGNPVTALQALGVPARGVYGYAADPHLPGDSEAVDDRGQPTVWTRAIADFFDEHVKNPRVAIAPELRPYGGPIPGPTPVTMLNAHPSGTIHYTVNGSDPTENSPMYDKPVMVSPGQTLKAIAVRAGLKPSRMVTASYRQGPPIPRLVNLKPVYEAKVGQPFELKIEVENGDGADIHVGGIMGPLYTLKDGVAYGQGGKMLAWFTFDEKTRMLRGTPPVAMACPLLVGTFRGDAPDIFDGGTLGEWGADAAQFTIVVRP